MMHHKELAQFTKDDGYWSNVLRFSCERGDFAVASDGRIAILCERAHYLSLDTEPHFEDLPVAGNPDFFMRHIEALDGSERAFSYDERVLLGSEVTCECCYGSGSVTVLCRHCEHEHEEACAACRAHRFVYGSDSVWWLKIEDKRFPLATISRVKNFFDLRFVVSKASSFGYFVFSFNGGFGVITGIKEVDE